MIRTQVYLTEDLYKKAKIYSQYEQIALSQMIRDGLAIALQRLEKKRKLKKLKNLAGKYNYKTKFNVVNDHNSIYTDI